MTASLTSLGFDCHVPRPTPGIRSPVFRVNTVLVPLPVCGGATILLDVKEKVLVDVNVAGERGFK